MPLGPVKVGPTPVLGIIQPFKQPERVVGFFSTYRNQYPVSRDVLREIADQFHNWVKHRCQKWDAPILEAPEGRRDDFVEPYFRHAQPDQVVVILKAREPARILTAIGNKKDHRWHLQLAPRWVMQYNFYVNDPHSRRYRLLPNGYRICLLFLKLFERIYAPLTAGLLRPFPQTTNYKINVSRNSTDSTNASPTLSMISCRLSASKPPDYECNENKISVTLYISH